MHKIGILSFYALQNDLSAKNKLVTMEFKEFDKLMKYVNNHKTQEQIKTHTGFGITKGTFSFFDDYQKF